MRCAEGGGVSVHEDPAAIVGGELLLADAGRESFFASSAWYRTVVDHGLPGGDRACFVTASGPDGPHAIFPMRRSAAGVLASLTTPYTCRYAPIFAPGLDDAAMARAAAAFGRFCRNWPVVRLDALAEEAPGFGALLEGVRAAGLVAHRFEHFGNWHEAVRGMRWDAYLEARPGVLRETVRRKLRRIERDRAAEIRVIDTDRGLDAGIAAFESVYRRSWKEPEPFPAFNAALMRATAPLGLLRLGVLCVGGVAVAAQLWLLEPRRATVLKLAHDEAFKAISPGTALTAAMLRRMLDTGAVEEIDFGRGDDPYKRGWASARRQRIGLLLIDPRRPAGLATLGREALAAARRRTRAWSGRCRGAEAMPTSS